MLTHTETKRHWKSSRMFLHERQLLYKRDKRSNHPLTDREMEVLSCVVKGMSNKEIATCLSISTQTVKNHVTSILRKLGVADRVQAVIYSLQRGWVKLNG